jgi:hypothetical protein
MTFRTCYQLTDDNTMLAVIQCANKLMDKKSENQPEKRRQNDGAVRRRESLGR